jgi:UDPglucose 6-dehydrogenase
MQKKKTVAIIGYGAVGKYLENLFPDAVVYDEPMGLGERADVNRCELAFVAVPTNASHDGSADTSIVEEAVSWLRTELIVLRSTVPVGTTARLQAATGKRIVFQPEYGPGETPDHHFNNPRRVNWVILGGDRKDTVAVADLYKQAFNADLIIHQTDSHTAELTKYMENCFLALKVTFCNEFYDIAERLGVDYNELRELWLLDPRIGRSHTFVMPDDRGFGGKCLPKDVSAMAQTARGAGYAPSLLMAMLEANVRFRAQSEASTAPEPVGTIGTAPAASASGNGAAPPGE